MTTTNILPDSYPLEIPEDCILYYDFADSTLETNDRIVDHSMTPHGNPAHGDIMGIGYNGSLDGPTWKPEAGGSLYFDGVNDSVEIFANTTSGIEHLYGASGMTICVWAKIENINAEFSQTFFNQDEAGGVWNGTYFTFSGTGDGGTHLLGLAIHGGNTFSTEAVPGIVNNIWMFYATAYNIIPEGPRKYYYVNGVQLGGLNGAAIGIQIPEYQPSTICRLGHRNGVRLFGGSMGQIMIFDKHIGAHKIKELHNKHAHRYGLKEI